MAIQIRYQNWPLGEWRFWRKWQIWQKWRIWHNWRKIARGLAISRMWQIFKRDAKSSSLESSLVNDILNFCGIFVFFSGTFFCFLRMADVEAAKISCHMLCLSYFSPVTLSANVGNRKVNKILVNIELEDKAILEQYYHTTNKVTITIDNLHFPD